MLGHSRYIDIVASFKKERGKLSKLLRAIRIAVNEGDSAFGLLSMCQQKGFATLVECRLCAGKSFNFGECFCIAFGGLNGGLCVQRLEKAQQLIDPKRG